MNMNGVSRLFLEILNSQLESGRYPPLDEKRVRESLTRGPGLTEDEQIILLLSPLARHDYQQVKKKIQEETRLRLYAQGVETELLAMAASSEDGDKMILKGNGFTVTLYRQENHDTPWVLLVQVGPLYLQNIYPMTPLRLIDSGGLEWLRGRPDANGEITASWNDPETDLLARSKRFSLILEPV